MKALSDLRERIGFYLTYVSIHNIYEVLHLQFDMIVVCVCILCVL